MEKFNYIEEMAKTKRESATTTLLMRMDIYEIVELVHKLEDEVTALENAGIKRL